MTLSVVIPAFNEERRLPRTLDTLFTWLDAGAYRDSEVLIVDDGSSDGTARVVEMRACSEDRLRLLKNSGNRGKGYSMRHGMMEARGDWMLMTDADLSAPIGELPKLFEAAEANRAVIAIGSRSLDRSLVGVHQARARELSGILFNRVMRLVTGLPFTDTQCGFKLYRRDAALEIFPRQLLDGFGFDVEDLVIAKRLGLTAVEVPVRWDNVEGTKVSLMSGLRSFGELFTIRWNAARGCYDRSPKS